ncbi:MAG: Hpt domain-containing protein [Zhongshania sp.]|uniref:Hpt domain-containing protein n=1 Tax=Zhongshania sp. TaxID=1971902 RepID=UPI00262C82FB|nr:Hpt domain-containing protein [Zhongshania sp.]MDF1692616.1 Hpt domain-containing protein [Zhongshania sp.]
MIEHLGYSNAVAFTNLERLLTFPEPLHIILLDAADTVENWESLIAQHCGDARVIILGERVTESKHFCLSKPLQKTSLATALDDLMQNLNGTAAELGAVEELLELFGAAGLAEMINALRVDLPQQNSRLEQALASQDYTALKHVAHALHGAALQFGANEFATLCSDIERRCAEQDAGIFTAPEPDQMMTSYVELISQLAANRYVD